MGNLPEHPLISDDLSYTACKLDCLLATTADSIRAHMEEFHNSEYVDVLFGQVHAIECARSMARHLRDHVPAGDRTANGE